MDSKIIAIIAVAIIAVAAVGAAVALSGGSGSEEKGVVYYGNGGTTSDGKTSYTLDQTTVQPCLFTYKDHTFLNWNTKADGTGSTYTEGSNVMKGVKLYAMWKDESGPKLKVTASNSYTKVYNLTLNDTGIDRAGEYDLKGNDRIYITANAGSAVFGVDGSIITIKVAGDDNTYTFTLMDTTGMTDLKTTISGTSVVISFGFTVGAEVHFGYAQGQLKE